MTTTKKTSFEKFKRFCEITGYDGDWNPISVITTKHNYSHYEFPNADLIQVWWWAVKGWARLERRYSNREKKYIWMITTTEKGRNYWRSKVNK